MRRPALVPALALLLAACGDPEPSVTPDPASGVGGAPSAVSVGVGGEGGSSSADASSSDSSTSTATSASASASASVAASSSASTGSGGSDPGGGYEDGTRLRAVTIDGADGSKQPVGWYDTERGEACGFRVAADGQLRCLPLGGAGIFYSDAACTSVITATGAGCTAPAYVAEPVGVASCYLGPHVVDPASGVEVRQVGAQTNPAAYYVKSGEACVSAGVPPAAYDLFAVGAPLDPSLFVAATYAGN